MIAYGWENRDFYKKWMGKDYPGVIDELKGPMLNSASPQSSLAPQLVDLFRKMLLPDTMYMDRIKRHYAMFRRKIDGNRKTRAR